MSHSLVHLFWLQPVCTTEIGRLALKYKELESKGVKLATLSCDPVCILLRFHAPNQIYPRHESLSYNLFITGDTKSTLGRIVAARKIISPVCVSAVPTDSEGALPESSAPTTTW